VDETRRGVGSLLTQLLIKLGRVTVLPFMSRRAADFTIGDRYEQTRMPVPPARYGAPHKRAFADYLAGPSTVDAQSFESIEEFLRGCTYVDSPSRANDWTKLTAEFESTRVGNCLDHSLWAWRKMIELGYDAELVIGLSHPNRQAVRRHAWVAFHTETEHVYIETTEKRPDVIMFRVVEPDVDEYWPEVGVRHDCQRVGYNGMIRHHKLKTGARWQDAGPPASAPIMEL
jgi:hypothetical protein